MTITSFSFLVFVLIGGVLYYLLPKSWQWAELLIMSLGFYFLAAEPYTYIYLLISTAVAYGATMYMARSRKRGNPNTRAIAAWAMGAIFVNIGLWFVLKGRELWTAPLGLLAKAVPAAPLQGILDTQLLGALGMGYYTVQVIGYILDCHWELVEPQKNPLKLLLFVGYFPQLTTGPINRYGSMQSLYEKHSFSYENITFGCQRILWGLAKKLVLAERVGALLGGLDSAAGCAGWVLLLLYPVQMYADFSGCMDIVIGVSEIFGVKMAENFNNPFFARTSQEFWQRWHITLGAWAKDYVLYPLLKSRSMQKLSKASRKKLGKRWGKLFASSVGMLALWLVMGVWHGGYRFILGVSLWYWLILMLGEICGPSLQALTRRLHIPTESVGWHLFQSLRTYLIYAVGAVFFRLSPGGAIQFFKNLKWSLFNGAADPWIFADGTLLTLGGITYGDVTVMAIMILLLVIVGMLREKYGYARQWVSRQWLPLRWLIWIGLFLLVLIYGKYGPGYSAADFIYQGF